MNSQDIDDILKSLDDEQENNSNEGFNRSKIIYFYLININYLL